MDHEWIQALYHAAAARRGARGHRFARVLRPAGLIDRHPYAKYSSLYILINSKKYDSASGPIKSPRIPM